MAVTAGPSAIGVLGMGTHLPARRLGNDEVAAPLGLDPAWIARRTGILNRHAAEPHEASSDLAAAAVRAALSAAGISADDVGLLLLATSTPDELGPATACRVQAAVGARNAVAMDVTAACSGWLFAAKVAHDWLRAGQNGGQNGGQGGHAVVVGVEVLSKFLNPADRSTAVLFGDGAAAAVLGPVPAGTGFAGFELGSDGTLVDLVNIPAGGSRMPASDRSLHERAHAVRMDGRAVGDFIAARLPSIVDSCLRAQRLQLADIDLVVAHQPNPSLLRNVATKIGVPPERLVIVADEIGNVGAACVPYALAAACARGQLVAGSRVLLAAVGAGMTWAGAVLTWSGATAVQTVGDR
ncbi:3-oxoacyl-ACP synthase III family protein [Virgisporangium aurantiacum]|uniref:3-oxoacyl-[acyl-carrier-protein] synthase 3 n=1 Tax=Virgisporangium aurantiacum TaxID=175570 RepID=A0A8J3ZD83_9ACTN|nr:ketoacyl-ACP synthase III [Virgisporangium aurantiacum]GIJ61832.1 3-oxoacyl-[acyl-carrier-protein] synthase 3 [Virgisporangium aurantiacum]